MPYDRTSDVPVLLGGSSRVIVASTANANESFYKEGGVWNDLQEYNDPSGFQNTGNFCIKGLAKTTTTGVGVGEFFHEIQLYPNPALDQLFIKGLEEQVAIKVIDIKGSILIDMPNFNSEVIDISNLNEGVYFVQISSNNQFGVRKIIVK